MSSCDVTNLMMQPQEYCSCDVCGNNKNPQFKKCTFETDFESSCSSSLEDVINPCDSPKSQKSQRSSCKSSFSSLNSKKSKGSIEALCPPEEPFECDEKFTPSGMCPPKTVGPLGKKFDCCSKYAPCGHWSNCTSEGHQHDKLFEAVDTVATRAPFGPYGPWNKFGPSKFKIVSSDYIARVYPMPKKCGKSSKTKPMGDMRPWPLSGSCRYAGRPYGPCRPFGAYKARGPFGVWENGCDPEIFGRPSTPAQPCWKPKKSGYRPCTPCHRPLYRPCYGTSYTKGECNYNAMNPIKCEPSCKS